MQNQTICFYIYGSMSKGNTKRPNKKLNIIKRIGTILGKLLILWHHNYLIQFLFKKKIAECMAG